ncbi:MAG: hypothetical protein DRQ49_01015 [Gammaproteobacteria bacterium]|nr:MAG: hypothetical protein DRQ41_09730 [Gammaproteobacteria bacterium]RKZ42755.1 MAG: hypothetical protein DRQ49_01015 [Gammaproteobacteria bacterium]RKZ77177.1 MAG: hypothetical protein DRQ57_00995 [Gammaproteobacteria bacterium]
MPFSDFKNIPQVQRKYDIKYRESHFITIDNFIVSNIFQQEFDFNVKNMDIFSSEAARCEIIIFPILREVYKSYSTKFAIWVQKSLSYDTELTGIPDYLVSRKSEYGKLLLDYPVLAVVEAKKNDFEQGWGQCLAELVASQKLNDNVDLPVYGIVTDGKTWEFGLLNHKIFTKNLRSFTIDDLSMLFAALNFVFKQIDELIA